MFARFLIPVTPVLLLLLELAVLFISRSLRVRLLLGGLIAFSVLMRVDQFQPQTAEIKGIVDESAHYPTSIVREAKLQGERLARYFDGLRITAGFVCTKAMLMYYSEISTAIECHTGLTDEFVAHQPLQQRGRPGHEKPAPWNYLRDRGTHFYFAPDIPIRTRYDELRAIRFDDLQAMIVVYDRDLMDYLQAYPEIEFVDFPVFLDQYLKTAVEQSPEQLLQDVRFFEMFYFEHNRDPERLQQFDRVLRQVVGDPNQSN
jgi:hypothetical protein